MNGAGWQYIPVPYSDGSSRHCDQRVWASMLCHCLIEMGSALLKTLGPLKELSYLGSVVATSYHPFLKKACPCHYQSILPPLLWNASTSTPLPAPDSSVSVQEPEPSSLPVLEVVLAQSAW